VRRGAAFWLASGFGSGLSPWAPGTAGSLAALAAGAAMLATEPMLLPLAAVASGIGGVWAIRRCGADRAPGGDPGWVVIDEFAGQWIALLPLVLVPPAAACNPPALALAFLAFRLLDILKPGPIGWADRQEGAAGIMADDVIAGLLAAGVVRAAQLALPGWFAVPAAVFY